MATTGLPQNLDPANSIDAQAHLAFVGIRNCAKSRRYLRCASNSFPLPFVNKHFPQNEGAKDDNRRGREANHGHTEYVHYLIPMNL